MRFRVGGGVAPLRNFRHPGAFWAERLQLRDDPLGLGFRV